MQADLFQVPSSVSHPALEPKESILEKFRISLRLDQSLMILISLVIVYVIVFSVGFEKGKKTSARDYQRQEARKARTVLQQTPKSEVLMIDATQLPAAGTLAAGGVQAVVTAQRESLTTPAPVPAADELPKALPPKAGKGKFTIQLVTFNTQAEADRLIEKLAQKGYRGFSSTQGKYRLVFVNDFESRAMASAVLKDLVAKGLAPKDAYVRNMPKGF